MKNATVIYDVWNDETGNRIGGEFHTLADAEALLQTMLRVNGPQVVSDLAIVAWRPNAAGKYESETVIEGAEFVARHRTPA